MVRGDRSVDVFVRKLRQKLEQASPDWRYIHTHFGIGYRFAAEPADGSVVAVDGVASEVVVAGDGTPAVTPSPALEAPVMPPPSSESGSRRWFRAYPDWGVAAGAAEGP